MIFTCLGVRGSRPVPHNINDATSLFYKIMSSGLKSEAKLMPTIRQYGLSRYDVSLFLGPGGNTSCVHIDPQTNLSNNPQIIIDLGSGACNFKAINSNEFHVFMTHFHYDHIAGLPFFTPLYDKNNTIHFYSSHRNFKSIIRKYLYPPYFPITLKEISSAKLQFHDLRSYESVFIGDAEVVWHEVPHPGKSFAYKVMSEGKSVCLLFDIQINERVIQKSVPSDFLKNIDHLVIDSSLNFEDSITKRNWGHSNIYDGINLANMIHAKNVFLFHFEPTDTENDIALILQTAQWFNRSFNSRTNVYLAREGYKIKA